jgi:hypothetical protein
VGGFQLHAVHRPFNSPLRRPIKAERLKDFIQIAQHKLDTFSKFRLIAAFRQFHVAQPDDQVFERLTAGYG